MEMNQYHELEVVSVRLVKNAPLLSNHKICSPEDAIAVVGEMLCRLDREVICVINLKSDGTPINCHFASMGSINQSIASSRELFKSSILSNAVSMIMVHNHPSGNIYPSKTDIMTTDKILQISLLMDIPLEDHVIVGGDNQSYFSFREKKMLKNPHISYHTDYEELQFAPSMVAERKGR